MASGADVVRVAQAEKSEIGGAALTNSTSGNKYCAWYQMDGYWCAMFVSYVMNKAGVPTSVVPKYAYCPDCVDFARSQGRLYSKSQITSGTYTPQAGDVFFRDGDHTGIVASVSGDSFTTIEGNTGGLGAGQRTVASHTFTFSDGNYTHIFNPNYPDKSSSGTSVYTIRATDFPKYSLSESAIIDIAKCVTGEQGGDDLLACKQEASQLANLSEVTYGRSNTEDNIIKTLHSGWYASDSWTRGYTETAVEAVKSVLVEGKRVLPRYVTEHDYFPLDAAISGHWNNGDSEDRSQYIKGQTTVAQNPSRFNDASSYTFYCFFGTNKDKDIAGYYNKDYITYKSDVPYGEGEEEYYYSENSYSDTETEPTVVWNNRVAENIHEKMQTVDNIEPTGELAIYANGTDITNIVGDLSWKNSIYELSTTMSINTPKAIGAYLEDLIYTPEVGDIVQQVTNEEIFRGVIIKIDDGDRFTYKCDVVDLGWYLNKTQQTYQFKNITAAEAIQELCEDLSVNIVMLPDLTVYINEIYFDKTISDIITDILDKCDGDYNYDFVPEGLRIYEIGTLTAYPEFTVATNIPEVYSPDYRGEVSHSYSIEDMRNSIKITSEKDNVYTELKVVQNRDLIDKYGFLQEVVKIDTDKESADEVAAEKIAELSKVGESFSFTIIEKYDSYTRAGEVIDIGGTKYVIESTDHSFKGGHHYNKLELKKV